MTFLLVDSLSPNIPPLVPRERTSHLPKRLLQARPTLCFWRPFQLAPSHFMAMVVGCSRSSLGCGIHHRSSAKPNVHPPSIAWNRSSIRTHSISKGFETQYSHGHDSVEFLDDRSSRSIPETVPQHTLAWDTDTHLPSTPA